MTIVYDYAWVGINLSDFSWPCTTMCDSVLLWMTLYFTVWLCLTLEDSIGHCMTLHDPVCLCITLYDSEWFWITLLESVSLILTVFWFFSYCFIPFNCLNLFKMFNSVRKCSTHAVMNKFWACQLNMFRMIQNGAKWIKWFKKAQKEFTVFKLCLRNLDFVSSYAPMRKFCACFYKNMRLGMSKIRTFLRTLTRLKILRK